jgi:serine/threonine protein phosphatase 1
MNGRILAIGDIHGCSAAFQALVDAIDPKPDDTIIPLGDFVDRGIDSRGVLDQLIELRDRCNLVPILGNHDQMMLHARDGRSDFQFWLNCGGDTALDSYGSTSKLNLIPQSHFRFLESCHSYYETDTHFFVHANFNPDVPLDQLDDHTLRWLSLRDYVPPKLHCSGKIAVMGHTPQAEILDLGHLICLDTGCCNGGWLTAWEVNIKQCWQVNEKGQHRIA